jgi:hypothetical protein
MLLFEHTSRFGGHPALKLGRLCALYFPKSKPKCGVCFTKRVEMKHGTFNLTVLNIGPFLFMFESPAPLS